ncbi:hypothetical protein [Acinetobacter sp. WCHAc060025]|uniref:hypothetical protein n=1 Tax=Acinetobacter sp. WCHAc060025 TaxID=2518625 RepID=UPI0010239301|nr:hypothetical protein [Acinetobacter sp. WCHAc060025]RZG76504.1 hypothetical protein EXE09_07730 [Acinetobacter sp. WCHAc060025]
MFKNSFIKHLKKYVIALSITMILLSLQLVFPKHQFVETYFIELTLSDVMVIIAGIALVGKFLSNMFKIRLPNSVQKVLNFFIDQISGCFIAIFGFCTSMIIINIIYGNYEVIALYSILGLFGIIYGSATIFLNVKLEIRGYLT